MESSFKRRYMLNENCINPYHAEALRVVSGPASGRNQQSCSSLERLPCADDYCRPSKNMLHSHRDVAEPNFALHESHCRRFLCLCPDCAEPVPRDQLAQHKDEQHAQVKCSECCAKMERRHLSEHQSDECLERLQSCPICELEVCFRELDEHLLVCGSRTELCSDCSCYVKLRDLQDHSFTCSTRGNRPAASDVQDTDGGTGDFCRGMSSFSAEDTEEHELKRFSGTVKDYEKEKVEEKDYYFSWKRAAEAAASSNSHSHGSQDDGEDPDQISTCPHCLLALPVRTLHWHELRCQTNVLLKGRTS